jgi:hypothetical protein
MGQPANPVELRARIDAYYLAMTAARTPFKALAWYADRIGVTVRTVRSWCSGERNPYGPAVLLLEYQERYDVGEAALNEARNRLAEYRKRQNP